MKIWEKILLLWHDLYYAFAGRRGVEFAMRCRDVVEELDVVERAPSLRHWFRVHLHLSLCAACSRYARTGQALRRAIRDLIESKESPRHLDEINQELLHRHGRS